MCNQTDGEITLGRPLMTQEAAKIYLFFPMDSVLMIFSGEALWTFCPKDRLRILFSLLYVIKNPYSQFARTNNKHFFRKLHSDP